MNEYEVSQCSLGQLGGQLTTDASGVTGVFCAIQALTDLTAVTVTGNITGIAAKTIPQGVAIFGRFTAVTYTGTAILYKGV